METNVTIPAQVFDLPYSQSYLPYLVINSGQVLKIHKVPVQDLYAPALIMYLF